MNNELLLKIKNAVDAWLLVEGIIDENYALLLSKELYNDFIKFTN